MFRRSTTHKLMSYSCALTTLLALSCKKEEAATPIVSAACTDPTASVVITDPTNYALSDSFVLEHVVVKDNTDLKFDWSQLTVDFFGKAVNPLTDINTVSISLWNMSPSDIEQALKVDSLSMMLAKNVGIITTYPDGTYTQMDLMGFNELGNPLPADELWVSVRHRHADVSVPAGPVHLSPDGAERDRHRQEPAQHCPLQHRSERQPDRAGFRRTTPRSSPIPSTSSGRTRCWCPPASRR